MSDTPTAEQRARWRDLAAQVPVAGRTDLARAIESLLAALSTVEAERDRLAGVYDEALRTILDKFYAITQLEAERDRLRDALAALGSRHGWIPDFGPCICEEHNRARALLRGDTQGNQT